MSDHSPSKPVQARASVAAQPIAPWVGGKRLLAKRLCRLIASVPHRHYIEPFIGMGGVFLRRAAPAEHEVINDASGDVANLFRVQQRHPGELTRLLAGMRNCRRSFSWVLETPPHVLTDIERAGRFILLQKLAFGGKVVGRSFGTDRQANRFSPARLSAQVMAISERLAGVVIENLDFADLLARYDHAEALVFLDPPYWGCEGIYGPELFGRADFERLAGCLRGLRGRFILTINDLPETRAVFAGFDQHPVSLTYSLSGPPTQARELVITSPGLAPAGL